MRTTTRVFLPGQFPQASSSSSRTLRSVELPDEFDIASHNATDFSFGAPDEDELSIAASEGGLMPSDKEDLAGIPPSGAVAQSEYDAGLRFPRRSV